MSYSINEGPILWGFTDATPPQASGGKYSPNRPLWRFVEFQVGSGRARCEGKLSHQYIQSDGVAKAENRLYKFRFTQPV